MRAIITTLAGAAITVAGVWLFSPRAAVVATGLMALAAGLLLVDAGSDK